MGGLYLVLAVVLTVNTEGSGTAGASSAHEHLSRVALASTHRLPGCVQPTSLGSTPSHSAPRYDLIRSGSFSHHREDVSVGPYTVHASVQFSRSVPAIGGTQVASGPSSERALRSQKGAGRKGFQASAGYGPLCLGFFLKCISLVLLMTVTRISVLPRTPQGHVTLSV